MRTSGKSLRALLGEKRHLLIDLDGVVYEGAALVPGAADAIGAFRAAGKSVLFLTNNSTRRPGAIAEKLRKLGIACSGDDVLNSALATALFLRERRLDRPGGAFVIGTDEFRALLQEHGIRLAEAPDRCSALVAGMDMDFNYGTISTGLVALQSGVPFVICNRDANFPSDGGILRPACGSLIGALEAASLRRADHDVGKPSPLMLELALERLRARRQDCVVIGDTLDTDIAMASAAGVASVLIQPPGRSRRTGAGDLAPTARASSLHQAAQALESGSRR